VRERAALHLLERVGRGPDEDVDGGAAVQNEDLPFAQRRGRHRNLRRANRLARAAHLEQPRRVLLGLHVAELGLDAALLRPPGRLRSVRRARDGRGTERERGGRTMYVSALK